MVSRRKVLGGIAASPLVGDEVVKQVMSLSAETPWIEVGRLTANVITDTHSLASGVEESEPEPTNYWDTAEYFFVEEKRTRLRQRATLSHIGIECMGSWSRAYRTNRHMEIERKSAAVERPLALEERALRLAFGKKKT